ncbi:unnamed protein product [Blepharisma stoltei]|uniref:Aspartate aminotransferase n=1 Tax=Blepharisma stoltei TaxID=1481888 RepID=A0AAU9K7M0_9CILI|nr:unnamed protein product [Blepharisma stoltei]
MLGSDKFGHIKLAPDDAILQTAIAFRNDSHTDKVNLGVGAYRTDEGKPLLFRAVKEAEKQILADPATNKEYLGIDGHLKFNKLAQELLLGESSSAVLEKRVASVQTISGTGSLRIGAEFLSMFFNPSCVLISRPTWGNHITIFERARIPVKYYPYWNPKTKGVDIEGMINALNDAPEKSIVLLHACAHNPTGVDPTPDQWERIADVMARKDLLPYFDSAYQGFATGSIERDAFAIRMFISRGFQCVISQSFAKNMGLYGERIGALHIVCRTSEIADKVLSQLKIVIRPMYSNPPMHGALIAAKVLEDPALKNIWLSELEQVSQRIIQMRRVLLEELVRIETPGDWTHITSQIGMFSFTGLSPAQCENMIKKWHCYMLTNGRISMAGINSRNYQHVARAIKDSLQIREKL